MRKSFQFMLGILLLFAFCSIYAQQSALSTGKAPFNKANSHVNYGTFSLADIAYANDNSTSSNISMPIPGGNPFTVLGSFTAPNFGASMCLGGDGNYYLLDVAPALYLFDPGSGACTLIGNITGMGSDGANVTGIAYDPINSTYYLTSIGSFYSFDINSLTATLIGAFTPAITGLMIDLCFDENGTCYAYAVDINAGAANGYIIDINTAALTTLGYVGFTPNYGQGMSYDYETQTIYLAAFNYDTFTGQLRTMDKNTGATTLLYDWGDQIAPFALNSIPNPCPQAAASNPYPPNNATDISGSGTTLTWDNGAGAVSVDVWFGPAGNVQEVYSGIPITSWPTGALVYNTHYNWRVVCHNDTCGTSSSWSFMTEQDPNLVIADFYPQNVQYWTGNTEGSTKTDGEINTVYPNEGWAAYDISAIPPGSVVQEVNFYGYVNATYFPYWSATPMGTVNPISDDASAIYNQIFNNSAQGVAYIYSNESSSFGIGWHNYPMVNTALADLQAAVNAGQGWFGMGFIDRDGVATYYVNFDGHTQANPPYIKITYVPPVGNTFTDNFDSYTVGEQLACQNSIDWTTWSNAPCGTEDPYISDNHYWSPSNTVVITQNNDLVHVYDQAGPITSGTWYVSFAAYIPSGNAGYFNTLAVFDGNNSDWAMECYFDAGGAGRLLSNSTVFANFTWPQDTWFQMIVQVNLDADQAQLMMATNPQDITTISTWQWTTGGGGTHQLSLDANDFFGATAVDQMYMDNYYFSDQPPVIIPVEFTAFSANVTDGNVVLNWQTATETNNQGFEVQRNSGNGFQTVGFVQGNGTSTQVHNYSFVDKSVATGNYTYRLRQVDFDGKSAYSNTAEVTVEIPKVFALEQNYPNPFNPSTQINFSLAADSKVTLKVFNILGQEVATLLNGSMTAGTHFVNFNAAGLSSGVYIYRIEANGANGNNFTSVKKMVLTK